MDDPACETPETRPGRTWKRATKYAQVESEVPAASPLGGDEGQTASRRNCTALHLHCTALGWAARRNGGAELGLGLELS